MSELSEAAAAATKSKRAAPPPPPPPQEPSQAGGYEDGPAPSQAHSAYIPREEMAPPPGIMSALGGGADGGGFGTAIAPMGLYGEPEPALMPGFIRKPFGTMDQKLAWEERPNYHRHWFNDPQDKPGRIEEAYNAGYSHVRDRNGRPVVRTVGRGGLRAYLMECPAHMWLADMTAQERINQRTEQAIRGGKLARNPDDDTRYVPRGAIRFEDE